MGVNGLFTEIYGKLSDHPPFLKIWIFGRKKIVGVELKFK